MSQVLVNKQSERVTLSVVGEFTFGMNREFREAYKANAGAAGFVIDLSQSTYMDSAGLGMLVQLRDFAGGNKASVSITGANETIHNILQVAKFNKLFEIA